MAVNLEITWTTGTYEFGGTFTGTVLVAMSTTTSSGLFTTETYTSEFPTWSIYSAPTSPLTTTFIPAAERWELVVWDVGMPSEAGLMVGGAYCTACYPDGLEPRLVYYSPSFCPYRYWPAYVATYFPVPPTTFTEYAAMCCPT